MADPWFKCNPGDFLYGLEELASAEQVAVYVVVIFRIYDNGGPISDNPSAIGVAAKLGPRRVRRAIDELVESGKLYRVDDRLMNRRAADELSGRSEISSKRAAAGRAGGKASGAARQAAPELPLNERRTSVERASNERGTTVEPPFHEKPATFREQEMAENSQSGEANASYARARTEEIEIRTPLPPSETGRPRSRLADDLPDFDSPIVDDAERARLIAQTDIARHDHPAGEGVDIEKLIGRIMHLANMIRPPSDLSLVGGWVRQGIDPERVIIPVVTRLSGNAKRPPYAMRYFHDEILRTHAAEAHSTSENIAYFRSVQRRTAQSS